MAHLGRFSLRDMIALTAELRRVGSGETSLEGVAGRLVDHLYDTLRDPETGERDCVLIRCYKTHPFAALPDDLQEFVRHSSSGEILRPVTKCLTLLATRGSRPEWNDRRRSVGHRAVPLVSGELVAGFPMIAQLVRQFGLDVAALLDSDPDIVLELDEKTYNVFYVPEAIGSAAIPAQDDFVVPFAVASVLGFGGMLPTGDLFAVILFSCVSVPPTTAQLFETIALSVKLALLPLASGHCFEEDHGPELVEGVIDAPLYDRHPRLSTIEQLLAVHERTAEAQAARVEEAHDRERLRGAQLRGLADAAIVVNAGVAADDILGRVTEQARLIVGAHQSVASLTTDQGEWAQAITATSLSDRYDAWRGYEEAPDGSGVYTLVCETNRPLRLTQEELISHPRWRGFARRRAGIRPCGAGWPRRWSPGTGRTSGSSNCPTRATAATSTPRTKRSSSSSLR